MKSILNVLVIVLVAVFTGCSSSITELSLKGNWVVKLDS
jgi:hypothetical protein